MRPYVRLSGFFAVAIWTLGCMPPPTGPDGATTPHGAETGIPAWAKYVKTSPVDPHATFEQTAAALARELQSPHFVDFQMPAEQIALAATQSLEAGHRADAAVLLSIASYRFGSSSGQSPEGFESHLDVMQIGLGHKSTPQRLLRCLTQKIWRDLVLRTVDQRAARGRDRDGTRPGAIAIRDACVVERDARGNAEPTFTPLGGKCQVAAVRQDVRQAVESKGRLMREHPLAIRPQPDDRQLLVLGSRKVNQSIHPMPDSDDAACPDVLEQQMRREPSVGRLLRCEVAGLGARCLVEAIPAWSCHGDRHA